VFQQRKRAAIFGVGPGATRDPFEIELAAGANDVVFLCDNMVRSGEGKKASDFKGIFGDVYVEVAEAPLGGGEWLPLSGSPITPQAAALSRGIGSDSQRPFAIVILGGLIGVLSKREDPQKDGIRISAVAPSSTDYRQCRLQVCSPVRASAYRRSL
jgi:hypothetical protein